MAIFAIGDVQGCYLEMRQLLREINYRHGRDRLWFVGDLVNRGPESLAVLRYIADLGPSASITLGNHDLHLLRIANNLASPGAKDTLHEVLAASDCMELMEWLRMRPLLHISNEIPWMMVHAGIYPFWSYAEMTSLAKAFESRLHGDNYLNLLQHLYGDQPDQWADCDDEIRRMRFICNVMTRMRYCSDDGRLYFHPKDYPNPNDDIHIPWFDLYKPDHDTPRVVVGHWSALGLHETEAMLAIDTGCIWGRKLTAVRLDRTEPEFYQVARIV